MAEVWGEQAAVVTGDGHGVPRSVPPAPHRAIRTLLPLSWFKRPVEITLVGGESLAGQLLDCCPTGPILLVRISESDATRRIVSWDQVRYIDLREG